MDTSYLANSVLTAATGQGTTSRPTTDWITQIIEAQRQASQAQRQGQIDSAMAQYNASLSNIPQQYQPLRNQAYTDQSLADRVMRERMANMGYSGQGGMSQTLQQRNTTNLLGNLGAVDRQQQGATDALNLGLTQFQTQMAADAAAENSQFDAQLAEMLLNQANVDASKENETVNLYYQMFQNGSITAAQFNEIYKNLTGKTINVKKKSSGSRRVTADPFAELQSRANQSYFDEIRKKYGTYTGAASDSRSGASSSY